MGWIGRKTGVANPRHLGMLLEVFCDSESVLAVPDDAKGQRLDPLEELPRIVRADGGPEIAQGYRANPKCKCNGPQRVGEIEEGEDLEGSLI